MKCVNQSDDDKNTSDQRIDILHKPVPPPILAPLMCRQGPFSNSLTPILTSWLDRRQLHRRHCRFVTAYSNTPRTSDRSQPLCYGS
jgi:hypothetical protein